MLINVFIPKEKEIAIEMFNKDMDINLISEITKYSIDEIKKLQ